jgi:hypothetical protein
MWYKFYRRVSGSKVMKKMSFLLFAMGLGVLLMSSGAGAISVKLIDANNDNTVLIAFSNFSPYTFGYTDTSGAFYSIPTMPPTPYSFSVIGTSIVDFVLAMTKPLGGLAIYAAGMADYLGNNLALLTFNTPSGSPTITIANAYPPDGIAPAPEPATLLLLSSVMVVGCGVLYNKIRNRQERRAV